MIVELLDANTEDHYAQARTLVDELSAWDLEECSRIGLDVNLVKAFYYSSGEEPIPGAYAPPDGAFVLAIDDPVAVGCGAFRRLDAEACEMRHLWVRPAARGSGIARRIAERLIATAHGAGYSAMRLETTTFMSGAIALYDSLGFRRREPYGPVPEPFVPITVVMELELSPAS